MELNGDILYWNAMSKEPPHNVMLMVVDSNGTIKETRYCQVAKEFTAEFYYYKPAAWMIYPNYDFIKTFIDSWREQTREIHLSIIKLKKLNSDKKRLLEKKSKKIKQLKGE